MMDMQGWKQQTAYLETYVPLLPPDLPLGPCLSADLRPEAVHFFDNQSLHALDGVLFFKCEIKFLKVTKEKSGQAARLTCK